MLAVELRWMFLISSPEVDVWMPMPLAETPWGHVLLSISEAWLGRAVFAEAFVDCELTSGGIEASHGDSILHFLVSSHREQAFAADVAIGSGNVRARQNAFCKREDVFHVEFFELA